MESDPILNYLGVSVFPDLATCTGCIHSGETLYNDPTTLCDLASLYSFAESGPN